jgi:hypothetical protein
MQRQCKARKAYLNNTCWQLISWFSGRTRKKYEQRVGNWVVNCGGSNFNNCDREALRMASSANNKWDIMKVCFIT